MSPTAVVTPGALRTLSSVVAGIVGASARMSDVCEPLKLVFVTTTASVPSYAACVRFSAAPDIVSVRV